ncbi:hypothetical protein [Zavarzinia sp. CC-PAN008]|uniref:hypothetical protein n=1 Tax=Zavarzinia sp. CC-PAN008 TaxID=3243332 RepID=UPI003F745C98
MSEAEIRQAVDAGLTAELYRMSRPGRWYPTIIFGLIWVALWSRTPWYVPTLVLGLQVVGTLLMDWNHYAWRSDPWRDARARAWAWRYAALSIVTGLSWGLTGALWIPLVSAPEQLVFAVLLTGVSGLAIFVRCAHRPTLALFLAATIVPYLVALAQTGSGLNQAVAAGGLLYGLALPFFAEGNRRHLVAQLRLEVENRALADQMARARAGALAARQLADEARADAERAGTLRAMTTIRDVRALIADSAPAFFGLVSDPANAARIRAALADVDDALALRSGTIRPDPQPFALDPLLREVAQAVRAIGAARGHPVLVDVQGRLPAQLVADRRLLLRVLVGLGEEAAAAAEGEIQMAFAVHVRGHVGELEVTFSGAGVGFLTPGLEGPESGLSPLRRAVTRDLLAQMNGRRAVLPGTPSALRFTFLAPLGD